MFWKCHIDHLLKMDMKQMKKDYTHIGCHLLPVYQVILWRLFFEKEIHMGDRLYFEDMAIYSMVKK